MKSSINPGVYAAASGTVAVNTYFRAGRERRTGADYGWTLRPPGDEPYRNLSGVHDSEGQQAKKTVFFKKYINEI